MNTAFLSDLLNVIADRGRNFLGLPAPSVDPAMRAAGLAELCERLLTGRGEASGTALAREMLDILGSLDEAGRTSFYAALAVRFGPDAKALASAVPDASPRPLSKRSHNSARPAARMAGSRDGAGRPKSVRPRSAMALRRSDRKAVFMARASGFVATG